MKKSSYSRNMGSLILLVFLAFCFQNCSPVFSELQSARTVGKDRVELTPSYSNVSFTEEGETEGIQNQMGLQAAYGITDKIDIRARYERIWGSGGSVGDGVNVAALGAKFSLVKDKISFYAPIGRAFGENSGDTWEFQPTFFFSQSLAKDKVEVTLGPKYIMTFCDGCDDFIAFNLGFSIGNDLNSWSIRPEYGMLFNPGESGYASQFSLGLSVAFDAKKQKRKSPEEF